MESKFAPFIRGMFLCALTLACLSVLAVAQEKKDQGPAISGEERSALEKLVKAQGLEAKTKAAAEYAKKFPKGVKRADVAGTIANEIYKIQDNNQKIKAAEEFAKIFNQPGEPDLVRPSLIEAYFATNKFDQALDESAKYLEKNPEDVTIHVQITWAGATQTQKQAATPKLMKAAVESAAKGAELMEADKKPSWMADDKWKDYRNSWLWRLYYARAVVLNQNGQKAEAKESVEKAIGLEPNDLGILILLVGLSNEEYQALAQKYQTEKKQEILDKALEKMDEVIDWMARGVAACEGNAQLKQTQEQLMDNLKQYYSFRFNGKTDGLQGLIEKYKKK
ncbi:MAG TPA: hypothetical protein PLK30_25050 [Blastocatellia bacterium]|nr:hypothetical protein [Blastocatellia bacterium]